MTRTVFYVINRLCVGLFLYRSKVYLEIDNRECAQSSVDCFSNTDQAASFIAAAHLRAELPYPVVSVSSE